MYDDDIEDDRAARDVTDPTTGRPRRLTEMCATCIMRAPGHGQINIGTDRVRAFIDGVRAKDSYVVCHSTIYRSDVDPAICRGYADRYTSNYLRIAERLGGFTDVTPPAERGAA